MDNCYSLACRVTVTCGVERALSLALPLSLLTVLCVGTVVALCLRPLYASLDLVTMTVVHSIHIDIQSELSAV